MHALKIHVTIPVLPPLSFPLSNTVVICFLYIVFVFLVLFHIAYWKLHGLLDAPTL
jgi:hypothetical protein